MSDLKIISDKNKKSLKIKSLIIKLIKKKTLSVNKLIIVIGGDGFMLETLKKTNGQSKTCQSLVLSQLRL